MTACRLRAPVAVMLCFMAGCTDGGGPKALAADDAPETFFAVTGESTRIVEFETSTGKERRTVVDVRRENGESARIDVLDLAPDRRSLYYSVGADLPQESIWQIKLLEGRPEQIADGIGPSVSPDGRRLAFVDGVVLHVRDLRTGDDQTFPGAVGELGGSDTSWSPDDRHVASTITPPTASVAPAPSTRTAR